MAIMVEKQTTTEDVSLEELARLARKRLREFFDMEEPTSVQVGAIRIATGVLATHARMAQTRSAREQLTFMMARELASDRDQLTEYIRVTMPNAAIVKALPQGS